MFDAERYKLLSNALWTSVFTNFFLARVGPVFVPRRTFTNFFLTRFGPVFFKLLSNARWTSVCSTQNVLLLSNALRTSVFQTSF